MSQPLPHRRTALSGILASLAASAAIAAPPPLTLHAPWTRPAAAGMTAAGYLSITSPGPAADLLLSASSPVAARVSIHQSLSVGGVMTMRQLPALPIPAHATVSLAPGGYHLMLEGLRRPLRLGDAVPVTLTFEKAGALRAVLAVRAAAPPAAAGGSM